MANIIAVWSPYKIPGGGKRIQEQFQGILRLALPGSTIEELSLPSDPNCPRGIGECIVYLADQRRRITEASVVIIQGFLHPGSSAIAYLARRYSVPYIVIPRGDFVPSFSRLRVTRNPCRKWLMWLIAARRNIRNAFSLVVSSELELSRLRLIGARVDHARVIPDAFKAAVDGPCECSNDREPSRPLALYLGRIASEKNLEFLVRLWTRVCARIPKALLVLAGPEHHKEVSRRLKASVKRLNLQQSVEFIPWLGGADKKRYLTAARCLLLPSFNESFGQTVLEAISVGTPVVVSNNTPWFDIPSEAGYCLSLKQELWVDHLCDYLKENTARRVPPVIAHAILSNYSESLCIGLWAEVLGKILRSSTTVAKSQL